VHEHLQIQINVRTRGLPGCIHILAQSHLTCRDLLFMYDVASQPVVGNDVASQPVASFGRSRWEASLITTSAHGVAGRTVGTLLMVLITPSALKVHFHAFGITGTTTTVSAKRWLIFSTMDGLCIMCSQRNLMWAGARECGNSALDHKILHHLPQSHTWPT
jgi:hypothetical protein